MAVMGQKTAAAALTAMEEEEEETARRGVESDRSRIMRLVSRQRITMYFSPLLTKKVFHNFNNSDILKYCDSFSNSFL